jgi:1-acyl-sn-glycerol-3-phosphate acyltransferase
MYARHIKDKTLYTLEQRQNLVSKTISMALYMFRVKTVATGFEKLPNKPTLFVFNHKSNLDALAILKTFYLYNKKNENKVYINLIVKHSLNKKKNVIYKALVLLDCFFLERDNPRSILQMYNKEIEFINEKHSLCLSPEGTRIYNDTFGEFKSPALKIAYTKYLPIVPIIVYGSSGLFDSNKQYVKPGRTIYLKALTPIQPQKFVDCEINAFANTLKDDMYQQYLQISKNPQKLLPNPKA